MAFSFPREAGQDNLNILNLLSGTFFGITDILCANSSEENNLVHIYDMI